MILCCSWCADWDGCSSKRWITDASGRSRTCSVPIWSRWSTSWRQPPVSLSHLHTIVSPCRSLGGAGAGGPPPSAHSDVSFRRGLIVMICCIWGCGKRGSASLAGRWLSPTPPRRRSSRPFCSQSILFSRNVLQEHRVENVCQHYQLITVEINRVVH